MPFTDLVDYSGYLETALYQTGNFWQNNITSSGYSSVSISGSNFLNPLNITGTGSVIVYYHDNLLYISGQVPGIGGGEANTASNLGNGLGLYSQKVDVDLQFKSVSGGSGLFISKSGNNVLINCDHKEGIMFVATPITWTNMPLALTFFAGSSAYATYCDLSRFTQVRLTTNVLVTGTRASILLLRYLDRFSSTVTDWRRLSSDDVYSTGFGVIGVSGSGYKPLVTAARSGVYLGLFGLSGNGVGDPQFGWVQADFA